jgi:glycosyltransferase involved in cell wall biosynthesis
VISVLLPVYNGEETLDETLRSILKQDFPQYEVILVDDGSTDESESVYKKINDPRLKIYKKQNTGLASTLNYGLSLCNFEFVSRIDQDDIMEKDFLSSHLEIFRKFPETICVTNWAIKINEQNEICGSIKPSIESGIRRIENLFFNKIVHSAVTFKKLEVFELGCYPTDRRIQPPEDYLLWSKLFENHKDPFYVIPKFLTRYRVTRKSMTQLNPKIALNAKLISQNNLLAISFIRDNKNYLNWVEYASSRVHISGTRNRLRHMLISIRILLRIFQFNSVGFSLKSLISFLDIFTRIQLPNNLKSVGKLIQSQLRTL